MVNRPRYRANPGGPPPLDESWWEAVLAEDEAEMSSASMRGAGLARGSAGSGKTSGQGVQLEPVPINWTQAIQLYEQDETICLLVTGYNRGGLLVSGEGLQGFVPVSHLIEMSDQVKDPEQWLKEYVDRSLLLKVIECDQERGRVVFSERAALAEPGSRIQLLDHLQTGDCIQGTVTNITDFGVFVDLGGVEGLIHVSEISWGRVSHPADIVSLGEQVKVFVILVDRERARVALSLKRMYPNPWATAEERYYPGQETEAVVTSIVPFGAFARLEEGLDGLIHVSEMSTGIGASDPCELREGQRVRVRVLHVDGSRQRLGLSLRLGENG